MTIVLVDMDGVLVDFESGFLRSWQRLHPDKPMIPITERTTYRITEQYPEEYRSVIRKLFGSRNFFRNLEPVPGGQHALEIMLKLGIEVFICTSPWQANHYSTQEKFLWVEQIMGRKWLPRLVISPDKTLIKGNVLIDDKPEIEGAAQPSWEHILYDHPYNRSAQQKKRLTWDNWQEVLLPALGKERSS